MNCCVEAFCKSSLHLQKSRITKTLIFKVKTQPLTLMTLSKIKNTA